MTAPLGDSQNRLSQPKSFVKDFLKIFFGSGNIIISHLPQKIYKHFVIFLLLFVNIYVCFKNASGRMILSRFFITERTDADTTVRLIMSGEEGI